MKKYVLFRTRSVSLHSFVMSSAATATRTCRERSGLSNNEFKDHEAFVLGAISAYRFAALVVASSVKLGVLPVQADVAPSRLESAVAGAALHAAVARQAAAGANPIIASEENLLEGAKIYRQMCARCHGLSNEFDNSYGRSFYPPAPPLPFRRMS